MINDLMQIMFITCMCVCVSVRICVCGAFESPLHKSVIHIRKSILKHLLQCLFENTRLNWIFSESVTHMQISCTYSILSCVHFSEHSMSFSFFFSSFLCFSSDQQHKTTHSHITNSMFIDALFFVSSLYHFQTETCEENEGHWIWIITRIWLPFGFPLAAE